MDLCFLGTVRDDEVYNNVLDGQDVYGAMIIQPVKHNVLEEFFNSVYLNVSVTKTLRDSSICGQYFLIKVGAQKSMLIFRHKI